MSTVFLFLLFSNLLFSTASCLAANDDFLSHFEARIEIPVPDQDNKVITKFYSFETLAGLQQFLKSVQSWTETHEVQFVYQRSASNTELGKSYVIPAGLSSTAQTPHYHVTMDRTVSTAESTQNDTGDLTKSYSLATLLGFDPEKQNVAEAEILKLFRKAQQTKGLSATAMVFEQLPEESKSMSVTEFEPPLELPQKIGKTERYVAAVSFLAANAGVFYVGLVNNPETQPRASLITLASVGYFVAMGLAQEEYARLVTRNGNAGTVGTLINRNIFGLAVALPYFLSTQLYILGNIEKFGSSWAAMVPTMFAYVLSSTPLILFANKLIKDNERTFDLPTLRKAFYGVSLVALLCDAALLLRLANIPNADWIVFSALGVIGLGAQAALKMGEIFNPDRPVDKSNVFSDTWFGFKHMYQELFGLRYVGRLAKTKLTTVNSCKLIQKSRDLLDRFK